MKQCCEFDLSVLFFNLNPTYMEFTLNKLKLSFVAASVLAVLGCNDVVEKESLQNEGVESGKDDQQVAGTASDFNLVSKNMQVGFVERQARVASSDGKSIAVKAQEIIDTMRSDGSWEGVDYSATSAKNWTPRTHLDNMRMIASAYVETQDDAFAEAAIKAMSFWLEAKPSAHWWWEDIGKPKFLGEVALMLGERMPLHQRFSIASIMPTTPGIRPSDGAEQTGGNRSDINLGVIYRGLLTQDDALVNVAIKDMEKTVAFTSGDGIQEDYSFHSHGPQLYSAGYGEVWFNATLNIAYMVRDTKWKFSQEKTDMLAAFFLDGWRWMKRGSGLDYNTWGRGLSRPKTELTPIADLPEVDLSTIFNNMDRIAALAPARAAEAIAFKAHEAGARKGVPSGLNGFKHFWRSDYSTKMADDHFFGIRMNSKRTEANESGNGENLLGYWLGFGSTFLEQRGDEYHNIFPVWNWKLIPGVTAPEYQGPSGSWGIIMQPDVSFVGGVTNGRHGVTTMDMNLKTRSGQPDEFTTQAKKSWFSFNDEIVALGAGIASTSSANVNTTLNQTLLNGTVTVDGVELSNGDHELSSATWVNHDGVGYIFPQNGERYLSNQTQTGNWKLIRSGSSADPVAKDVFTLRISHGVAPSGADYQYIIAPSQTAEQTEAYEKALPVTVLQNTSNVQAVRHAELSSTGIVFHQAGSIQISDDLTVSVDQPSVVLVDESGSEPLVSVSTPGKAYAEVNLTLKSQTNGEVTQLVMTHGRTQQLGNSVTFPFYKGAAESNQAFKDEIKQAEEDAKAEAEADKDSEAAAQEAAEAEAKEIAAARAKMVEALANGGVNLSVIGDGHIRGGLSADKNFGASGYMGVENHADNPSLEYRAVLNFDATGLAGINATSAKLKLHLKKVVDRDDNVRDKPIRLQAFGFVAPEGWSEKTMTWNTMPTIDGAPSSNILTLTESQIDAAIELDVTDIVNNLGNSRNLNIVLVNIDEKGKGGFIHIANREETVDGVAAARAAKLEIQGELEGTLPQAMSLTSTQDGFVQDGTTANNNYGTNSYMQVMSGVGNYHRRTFLSFDTSSLGTNTVTSAKLQLHIKNATVTDGYADHKLQALAFDATWAERELTWAIQPDLTNAPASPVTTFTLADKGKVIELDVTDLVNQLNGKKTLELALINPEVGNVNLIALTPREGGSDATPAPTLILK